MERDTTPEYPTVTLDQLVATNVRAAMSARRISTTDLARELHITQRAAQRRLSGHTPFSLSELGVVGRMLNVPYAALVSESPLTGEAAAA